MTVQVRDTEDYTVAVTSMTTNTLIPVSSLTDGIRELLRDVAREANGEVIQIIEGLENAKNQRYPPHDKSKE